MHPKLDTGIREKAVQAHTRVYSGTQTHTHTHKPRGENEWANLAEITAQRHPGNKLRDPVQRE